MAMHDLQELLKHSLGDLYFAEKTILKGLKKMAREVSNPELRARLEQHQEETAQQLQVLEQAFAAMGERAKAEKCPGILGIQEEHDEFVREEEPSKMVLEAFDLGSALRVEHYEIAGYRSAIALAKALGQREVVALLQQNLAQELAMAKFVERAAGPALAATRQQLREAGAQAAAGGATGGARRARGAGAKRGATAETAERAPARRRATAGAS